MIPHVSVPQRVPGIGAGSLPCLTSQDAIKREDGAFPEPVMPRGCCQQGAQHTHSGLSPGCVLG